LCKALASIRIQRLAAGVAHIKHVFRSLADGHDLRRINVDALRPEHLRHLRQQTRTIARDELDDRASIDGVLAEVDLRGRREHPHLARRATRHGHRRVVGLREYAGELLFDVADTRAIRDICTGIFEHVVDVETEAIGSRRDTRIDDGQAQLIEQCSGACKAMLSLRRVGRDGRAAALAALGNGNERSQVFRFTLGQQLRMPCDFLGCVSQEVGWRRSRRA
jgi:hypothetical protein